MRVVERMMKWLGIHDPVSRDEIINAQIEDNAREHSNVVDALQEAFSRRVTNNEKLRESIRIARQRTNSFADFERMAIRREEINRD